MFRQRLVTREAGAIVTLLDHAGVAEPVRIDGLLALEPAAPIVWFTFADAWHDIGRFHDAAGRFTGYYANVLTPVRFVTEREWHTTDLFLDVWVPEKGSARVLDEDELSDALEHGWLDVALAERARAEADSLLGQAAAGDWPPPVVRQWTLARAHEAAATQEQHGRGQ